MPFDLEQVREALAGTRFSRRIQHFESVGSTSTIALEAAQAGAGEGAWIADEQTAGRGRGNHSWHSVAGDGLYVSALVKPSIPARNALPISLAAGLAARSAIADVTGAVIDIRWPNDLLIGARKCGGILVETAISPEASGSPAMLRYAIIGIGINLNHSSFPEELANAATSLRRETGSFVSREHLLIALLKQIDEEMTLLVHSLQSTGEGPGIYARFAQASTWVQGKRVHVAEAGGYTGVTAGIDSQGFLLVDADDGTRRTVLSGGVREL